MSVCLYSCPCLFHVFENGKVFFLEEEEEEEEEGWVVE